MIEIEPLDPTRTQISDEEEVRRLAECVLIFTDDDRSIHSSRCPTQHSTGITIDGIEMSDEWLLADGVSPGELLRSISRAISPADRWNNQRCKRFDCCRRRSPRVDPVDSIDYLCLDLHRSILSEGPATYNAPRSSTAIPTHDASVVRIAANQTSICRVDQHVRDLINSEGELQF